MSPREETRQCDSSDCQRFGNPLGGDGAEMHPGNCNGITDETYCLRTWWDVEDRGKRRNFEETGKVTRCFFRRTLSRRPETGLEEGRRDGERSQKETSAESALSPRAAGFFSCDVTSDMLSLFYMFLVLFYFPLCSHWYLCSFHSNGRKAADYPKQAECLDLWPSSRIAFIVLLKGSWSQLDAVRFGLGH